MRRPLTHNRFSGTVVLVLFFLLSTVVTLFCSGDTVIAGTLERVVMPGDVIEGHAKYENECKRCHRLFSKEAQKKLCLECHKKVSSDVREKKGYHGKSPMLLVPSAAIATLST